MRLVLACCLMLHAGGPLWACQHLDDDPCHHCCHDANGPDDPAGSAPGCSHCVGHGQGWSVGAGLAGPASVEGADHWRPSREIIPPPVFADNLFKPPIVVPIA